MPWIGLSLIILSVSLLTVAIRGRVVARGRFCRKCRFDLAGLGEGPTCPECGRDTTQPKATRPTLRRASRTGIAAGALLLLAGLTVAGIAASNNTARVFAALPDRVVLVLHAMHVDAAFTEIATNRLMRIDPLPDATWARLIEKAMEHQADIATPWDPRHGEVLAVAFSTGRLGEEQIGPYLSALLETTTELPAHVRRGVDPIMVSVQHTASGRAAALTDHNPLADASGQIWVAISVESAHVESANFETKVGPSGGMTPLRVPAANSYRSVGFVGSALWLEGMDWSAIEPGTDLTIRVTHTVTLKGMDGKPPRHSYTVTDTVTSRVVGEEAELVSLNTDPDMLRSFRENAHIRLGPVTLLPEAKSSQFTEVGYPPTMQTRIARSHCFYHTIPIAVSGDMVVIHADREIRVGYLTIEAVGSMGTLSADWRVGPDEMPDESTLAAWMAAGSVTVELRPNPRRAERSTRIKEIIGVPLRFENVRFSDQETPQVSVGKDPGPEDSVGRPVEPRSEPED